VRAGREELKDRKEEQLNRQGINEEVLLQRGQGGGEMMVRGVCSHQAEASDRVAQRRWARLAWDPGNMKRKSR